MELINFISLSNSGFIHLVLFLGIPLIIAVVVALLVIFRKKRLIQLIQRSLDEDSEIILSKYNSEHLVKKSRTIVKVLSHNELEKARKFLYRTTLARRWVQTLSQYAEKHYFQSILQFRISEGYFYCFTHALLSEKLKKILLRWISEDPSRLKKIASISNGKPFNGQHAYKILQNQISLINEMVISPEWTHRIFGLRILLNDDKPSTKSLLFDLFHDPDPSIRKMMVQHYESDDRDRLKEQLFTIIIKDPNPEVRKEAILRFQELYDDYPSIETTKLLPIETIHLIQALRKGNKNDEALATELVLNKNLEIRYAAAHFLDESGVLSRFCDELDLSDKNDWDRKLAIYNNAAESGAQKFYSHCLECGTREALLLLGKNLLKFPARAYLLPYLKKAINLNDNEIYRYAARAAATHGGNEEKKLLYEEFNNKIDDINFLSPLIEGIKEITDALFIDPLITVMENHPDLIDQAKEALLHKEKNPLILRIIEKITHNGNTSERVKFELLFVLTALQKEYCLSFIFEQLPIIPIKWMEKFGDVLKNYNLDVIKEKIEYFLNQCDGPLRARLITLISRFELKDMYPHIKASLSDIDSGVRIASAFALTDLGDSRSIKQVLDLLRDPVENVRARAAYALARTSNSNVLKSLRMVLMESHEVEPVKSSILQGLSECTTVEATDILFDFLESSTELEEATIEALSHHHEEKNILHLIERMKDSSSEVQKKIAMVFKKMGLKARPFLMNPLTSELEKLKGVTSGLMDAIGATDEEIKKLSHKDPQVRREAARTLAMIGTLKAFRGLIIASRDPDREVRINVVKALEKLETDEGKEILNSLKEDPDKKIRTYTHWALERLRVKELV